MNEWVSEIVRWQCPQTGHIQRNSRTTYQGDVLNIVLRCECVILDGREGRGGQEASLRTVRPLPATFRLVAMSERLERQCDQHSVDGATKAHTRTTGVGQRRPGVGGGQLCGSRDGVAGRQLRRRRQPVPAEWAVAGRRSADGGRRNLLEIHRGYEITEVEFNRVWNSDDSTTSTTVQAGVVDCWRSTAAGDQRPPLRDYRGRIQQVRVRCYDDCVDVSSSGRVTKQPGQVLVATATMTS